MPTRVRSRSLVSRRPGKQFLRLTLAFLLLPATGAAQWSTDPAVNQAVVALPSDQFWPEIVDDGTGGFIMTWHDGRVPNPGVYVQRVNRQGVFQWASDGIRATTGTYPVSGYPEIISDGAGGAIVAWVDGRNGDYDLFAQRFSPSGARLWGPDGVTVCNEPTAPTQQFLIADGSGGAILAWLDERTPTYALVAAHLTSAGVPDWTANGVEVAIESTLEGLVPDGSGGAILVYQKYTTSNDLYAQRVNAAGAFQWGPGGVPLCNAPGDQTGPDPTQPVAAISDGAGGAIVTWEDTRAGFADVYAQRINGSGSTVWSIPSAGIPVCTTPELQSRPRLCTDGSGGAIVVWEDYRNAGVTGVDLFAQRITSAGSAAWLVDGVPVCTQGGGQYLADFGGIVSDGADGAIVGWEDQRVVPADIYAQRLHSSSTRVWPTEGVAVGTSPATPWNLRMVAQPQGNAIFLWAEARTADMDIYIQQVGWDGTLATLGGDPEPPIVAGPTPVTFSVNGPVDPHSDGIRDARGGVVTPQAPPQPGNELSFGIRSPVVPQATGRATTRPGDASDFRAVLPSPIPSEASVFQSAPTWIGGPGMLRPDGTNNQIVQPIAAGMSPGRRVDPAFWAGLDSLGDNIDAISFGDDAFPAGIVLGGEPLKPHLTGPPGSPLFTSWDARMDAYLEPVVLFDGEGVSFRFSVDPWAIGLPGTAVRAQSGGADAGAGTGPWSSPGSAAGDVFTTPFLKRLGGITFGATGNSLFHDNAALGLSPVTPPLSPMEDDLDALECVGTNIIDWTSGTSSHAGNVHARVAHEGPGADLPSPGVSLHVPQAVSPIFFSVTRNSIGAPGSAVRSSFVNDGGAGGDIFVMAKDPADPAGVGTNLLFIENKEIGLWSSDATPGFSGPEDKTDDLDGLILRICPEFQQTIVDRIEDIMTSGLGPMDPVTGARFGPGMHLSLTKSLVGQIPPGCIQVGFSVTTDAIGLQDTAVDYEAGSVDPPGGIGAAAGDVFYAEVDGSGVNLNYLWYEEVDLGLDAGTWTNDSAPGRSLAALTDNLDGLDSAIRSEPTITAVPVEESLDVRQGRRTAFALPRPNPPSTHAVFRYRLERASRVQITVFDVQGRMVISLVDRVEGPGEHSLAWNVHDRAGRRVPAGVYFVSAILDGESHAHKIVILD